MWPLAEAMAKACLSLGFQTVFEVSQFSITLPSVSLSLIFAALENDLRLISVEMTED